MGCSRFSSLRSGPCPRPPLRPPLRLQVVLLQADNRLAVETFEEVMGLAVAGCKAVAAFMREKLLEHVQQLALARMPVSAALQ
jgi:hypothetical protein